MRNIFRGFYRYTDEELKELWKDCKFVLDTNVLTHLYLYSKQTRDDLLEVLEKLSDRLWIPYQVALEFQENRINTIAGQKKELSEIGKMYSKIEPALNNVVNDLHLRKKHSPINCEQLIKEIKSVFDKFSREAINKAKEYPELSGDDKLREVIDGLFKNKIGSPPNSQNELDEIYKEGEMRYKWRQPPGFEDSQKSGAYWQDGLFYKLAYGDLLIWKQIIAQAKKDNNFKKIVFITNDEKEDWWWVEGGKTIGPRHELIDEILVEAKTMFYMYSADQFLKYAQDILGIESKPETKNEIIDISQSEVRLNTRDVGVKYLPIVSITTVPPSAIGSGGDFNALILLNGVNNLNAYQFDLSFDPSVIEIIGSEGGSGVTNGSIGGSIFPMDMWAFQPPGTPVGKIRVLGHKPGVGSATGPGFLAVVHFHVIGSSNQGTNLTLSNVLLFDVFAKEIKVAVGNSIFINII